MAKRLQGGACARVSENVIPSDMVYSSRYMDRNLSNTLGTWAILHHLSIKWDSMDICTANTEYKTVADFISKFFPCGGCASHFEEMYEMDRKGMVLAFRSFLLLQG